MFGTLLLLLIFLIVIFGAVFGFTPANNNQSERERNINWTDQQEQPEQKITLQQQIINKLLTIANSLTSPYQQAGITFLIEELNDNQISFENKLTKLNNSLIKWSATDKQELKSLIAKWQQEQSDLDKQAWISEQRWLTDREIDWAVSQLANNDRFKVLPAYQFNYVKSVPRTTEADAQLALPELLSAINDSSKELVFIPVNNPDFHWSLLVYEVKTKCFYHYDTLGGANADYIQALVQELLTHCHQTNELKLDKYLFSYYGIKQNNSYDCGVAVISFIKRIQQKYQDSMENIELGKFNFTKDREELRTKYLTIN